MNGCEFLRKKGEELKWNHQKLFRYFKLKIAPYTGNIKETCLAMLEFFHSIESFDFNLTAEIENKYELFMDCFHYQQFIDCETIIPPTEVQLMWIVHCLDPMEYYKDCYRKYKKLLDVKILSLSSLQISGNKYRYQQQIPYLNEFEQYLKIKLNTNKNTNIFCSPISQDTISTMYTKTNTMNTPETQRSWFLYNVHMKKSLLKQIEFINKINYIAKYNTFNEQNIYKSIHRYFKFLYLMALPMDKRPPVCIPTTDIDLIWHAHILNINNYHLMSTYLFPQINIIPHNHGMPVILEKQNQQITEIFWDKIFGENDYLNGRPFYITSFRNQNRNDDIDMKQQESILSKPKKRIIIRNNTPKHPKAPKPPIVLDLDLTPSPPPTLALSLSSPSQIKITRIPSLNIEQTGENKTVQIGKTDKARKKRRQIGFVEKISTKMLMEGNNELGNCYWPYELCADCYQWSFGEKYKRANIAIICCIAVCISLGLILFGAFVFIPNHSVQTDIIIKLYENNMIINKDLSITINSVIISDVNNEKNVLNEKNTLTKSISYPIRGIKNDIIAFDVADDDDVIVNGKPYTNDEYYYIDMEFHSDHNTISYNYTLSHSYFCCNNYKNNQCDEIGLLMPWMNKWELPFKVKQFNVNIFSDNNLNTNDIYSTWGGKFNANTNNFYLSNNHININKDLGIYFELLFTNNTSRINRPFIECNKQFEFFIYDNTFQYQQEHQYQTMMTLFDFLLISLSLILFLLCACYGCWWIMYLFDNSFCCDLCTVILT